MFFRRDQYKQYRHHLRRDFQFEDNLKKANKKVEQIDIIGLWGWRELIHLVYFSMEIEQSKYFLCESSLKFSGNFLLTYPLFFINTVPAQNLSQNKNKT